MLMIKKIKNSAFKKRILPALKNRYVLALISFVVWISFFDRNDLISQHSYKNMLEKLNNEKDYYRNEISKNRKDLNELVTNSKNLEKFARERYLMKKDNEDIFIIVEETPAQNQDDQVN